MSRIFFPSCKITQAYPQASKQLKAYLKRRFAIEPIGCCRSNYALLSADDTAVVVCNNCAAMIEESSRAERLEFVWELIDQDGKFIFPDYHGEAMTVQDCWKVVEKRPVQEAVRSLLRKMNIAVVEQPENYAKTRFCGVSLLTPCLAGNAKLAPKRYVENGAAMFTPCSATEQTVKMREHCAAITTETVVCYCGSCLMGIERGGKRGRHLLELLFPAGGDVVK